MNNGIKRPLSLVLVLAIVMSMLPIRAAAVDPKDVDGHWSADAIELCSKHEILYGYDGYFRPDDPITRAEFCAMVNRAYHFTDTQGAQIFLDVPDDLWYATDIAIASATGYLSGTGSNRAAPEDDITREQAFTILSRFYSLVGSDTESTGFADDEQISDWARGALAGLAGAGYVKGDGIRVFPKDPLTRGAAAQVLSSMFGYIADADTKGGAYQNLTVRKSGVTLSDVTASGDLFVTGGVGLGDASLEGVTIQGRTLISGGGANSVHVNKSTLGEVIIDSQYSTHLELSTDTTVSQIYLNSSGTITHGTVSVSYDAASGVMTFGGTIDQITLKSDGTATVSVNEVIYDIIPIKTASSPKTTFVISSGATIKDMVLHGPVDISGGGKIEKIKVHSPGVVIDSSVNVNLRDIIVDEGISIIIGGKEYVGNGGPLISSPTSSRTPVTGVTLSYTSVTLAIDETGADTLLLEATIEPLVASDKTVTWSSADESVATVDETGLITAVAKGETTVTVTTNSGKHQAFALVEVLGILEEMPQAQYLSAYASYEPFGGTIYLDWVSSEAGGVFNIYTGGDEEALELKTSVTGEQGYSFDDPGNPGTLYLEVVQALSDTETLSSGLLTLEFDEEGLSVPDEEEDLGWLHEEVDPFLLDTDNDGLSDGLEARLAGEGFRFDPENPYSYADDGTTLDGDVLLDYVYHLDSPPEDYRAWLSLKIPAKHIAFLSLADEAEANPFFGSEITGYIGAPAVSIDFPAELFSSLSDITLTIELSGDTAAKYISWPEGYTLAFTHFNDATQMFKDVEHTRNNVAPYLILRAELDHFSYYTVLDMTDYTLPEPDPEFDLTGTFTSNPTDVVFLIPNVPDSFHYPKEEGISAPFDAVRKFIDSFGDNLYYTGITMNRLHLPKTAGHTLPRFSNDKFSDGEYSTFSYSYAKHGLMDYSPFPSAYGQYWARALSIYFDTTYSPATNSPNSVHSYNYVDASYKSTSAVKALIVIAHASEIVGIDGDSDDWNDPNKACWRWISSANASFTVGLHGEPPQNYLSELGVELYLVGYESSYHEDGLMETYNTNDNVHTYYAPTAQDLNVVMDQIAYELGTVDVITDSNGDGISDFYTKRICDGSLRLGTGAQIRDDNGELLDFDTFQSGTDYDGDGIPNGEEIEIAHNQNGQPYIILHSNPGMKDTNGNSIMDADDPYPLTAWKATTALGRVVENAGFIYLEKGTNYNGNMTGDFLYSRIDAHQKDLGYCYTYDESIMAVSSAILCEPFYFYYGGKEWLIELWKGQYGIETGAEIGVYNRSPNDAALGKRVAANVAKMIEQQIRSVFGGLLNVPGAEDIFDKVMVPVRAIANASPDALISSIDAAMSVVRSNAVYGPLKLLLGQGRVDTIINALLTAKNSVNCKFFECVDQNEYLELSIKLHDIDGNVLFERNNTDHWWLTGFKWGEFTGDLGAIACEFEVKFKNNEMRDAFLNGMASTSSADYLLYSHAYAQMRREPIRLDDNNNDNDGILGIKARGYEVTQSGNTVSFTFTEAKTTQPFASMLNPAVLAWNRVLVSSYNALRDVLEINSTDPNAFEEKLLNFDTIFNEEMFDRYLDSFGNAVPLSLRSKSYSELTSAQIAQIKNSLIKAQDSVYTIIDTVSNMLFTIAKKVVG